MARLNVNLPDETYQELQDLAAKSGRNMTDFVKTALSLTRLALEETSEGNKIAVTDKKGKLLKEVVLTK